MNDLDNNFYSVDNYNTLLNNCNSYVKEKYSIDLQSSQFASFPKTLYQIMNHIYNIKKYSDLNELNNDVIKECKKYFKVNFSTKNEINNKNIGNTIPQIRDLDLNKSQTNIINERPIFNPNNTVNVNVNKDFDKIMNDRNNENVNKLPSNLNIEKLIEKPDNPEAFYENLKKLQSRRENDIPYHVPITQEHSQPMQINQQQNQQQNQQPNQEQNQDQQPQFLKSESTRDIVTTPTINYSYNPNSINGIYDNNTSVFSNISGSGIESTKPDLYPSQNDNAIANQFVLSHGDLMLERNNFLAETIRSNENINPSELYAENMNKFLKEKDYKDELDSKRQIFSVRQNDIIKTKTDKLIEHYVSINSDDKDWDHSVDLRYRYKVKFNNIQSKEYIKVPVYENSEFIPNMDNVKNTSGWYDDNNTFHEAYNPENPKGKILYYMNKLLYNSIGLSVDTFYKNIDSIALTKVLLPVKDYIYDLHCNTCNDRPTILSLPFIYVEIDEFDGIYQGTNNNIKKTFCKLIYDGCYNCDDGRGYIEFSPINHDVKKFTPNPLSSLNSLSISILKPDGSLLNDKKDIIEIKDITLEANKLKITTTLYFHKYDINIMDKIRIKNFKLDNMDVIPAGGITSGELQDYINLENGHFVGTIADINSYGYANYFYIDAPGTIDLENGTYEISNNIADLLTLQNTDKSFFINLSMQNYLEFTITTLEGDVSIFNSIPNLDN